MNAQKILLLIFFCVTEENKIIIIKMCLFSPLLPDILFVIEILKQQTVSLMKAILFFLQRLILGLYRQQLVTDNTSK